MNEITEKLDELFKQQDANWERYQKLLPDSEDLEIIVLKGHLIIEEMLYTLATKLCKQPKHFDSARLTFKQLCCVVRSLLFIPVLDTGWDAIAVLNQLRNKLAHNLEPQDINNQINELERLCSSDEKLPEHYKPPESSAGKAKVAICFIIGQLSVASAISEFFEQHRTVNFDKPPNPSFKRDA
jgi:hypothetical protein